jgi:hypothetical protein
MHKTGCPRQKSHAIADQLKVLVQIHQEYLRCLKKITRWKRLQVNKGELMEWAAPIVDYENPASIPTPTGKLLPLHLLVRRPPIQQQRRRPSNDHYRRPMPA